MIPEAYKGTEREMELLEAHAIAAMFAVDEQERIGAAIRHSLDLAFVLRAGPRQLQPLARLVSAAEFAGPEASAVADMMIGISHHLIGNQHAAQFYCERALAQEFLDRDQRTRALVGLARTLWLRGFGAPAASIARRAIEEAAKSSVNLRIALIYSATVFLWNGDCGAAEEVITKLIAEAKKHFA